MAKKKAVSAAKGQEKFETYISTGGGKFLAAKTALAAAPTTDGFSIRVIFQGGLTPTQKAAFKAAADRWTRIIVGDLPNVTFNNIVIDDLLIFARGDNIDGPGTILGQAGPDKLRPPGAGTAAGLPAVGTMIFDTADLAVMQQNGTLKDVITHEMGHVLGIGTIWTNKGLLAGAGGSNPVFTGAAAKIEFGKLKGTGPAAVPVANVGGAGTRDSHWREQVFRNELMSGIIEGPGNPISKMTVASLQDLGYKVNFNAAEPYALPNLMSLAEAGSLAVAHDHMHVLPIIPDVLPENSLL